MKHISVYFRLLSFVLLATQAGCTIGGNASSDLTVVKHVDIEKYTGTWYEIARYPNSFQKKCASNVTATYALLEDGTISVFNQCRTHDGSFVSAKATAWAADKGNAKLKVQFFWPFRGDYWIIDLGKDYEYAVVGHPDRKYLWILSRSPQMDEEAYNGILERLKEKKYDPFKLVETKQQTAAM